MPLPAPRNVKRPRPSLSCIICRRRKVRCGREHPQCANCVRMKENCVYEATVGEQLTGHVEDVSVKRQQSESVGHLTWSHWRPGETDKASEPHNGFRRGAPAAGHVAPLFTEGDVPARKSSTPVSASETTSDVSTRQQQPFTRDYLSLRRGGHTRYIGQAFWGSVAGLESVSDDFLNDSQDADPVLPPPHVSSFGIIKLLRSLPTKAVSDALLDAFLCAVWPLAPLVSRHTLQADYDKFWDWCAKTDTNLPPDQISDDPSFFCLLFGVLYCGACTVMPDGWTAGGLRGLEKESITNRLKGTYESSLTICQHLEHPTTNSLVSMLLTGPFLERPDEPMRASLFVSTIVRLAQSMGLHRDGALWSELDSRDRDIRRRVWWHIVRLDVHSSISTGLPSCIRSEQLARMCTVADPSNQQAQTGSIAILFAAACSEAAHLQSRVVECLQGGRLTHMRLEELLTGSRGLQQKIDALITRIPSLGVPEKGLIPSRLGNTSPITHRSFYSDDAVEPTVLGAWTRIMLTLMKLDVAILLQKPCLPPPNSLDPQSCKAWNSMTRLCVSYIRIFLPLHQTPAFAPYQWYLRGQYGLLQALYLTLTYLEVFKGSREIPLARYFVDEAIGHIPLLYKTQVVPAAASEYKSRAEAEIPLAIQTLVDLHSCLDSSASATLSMNDLVELDSPKIIGADNDHDRRPDPGLIPTIAELESWSASLIPNDL
ncbi:hypothetical protein BJX64DRAFT_207888 [Aspergillus heterothallicus]